MSFHAFGGSDVQRSSGLAATTHIAAPGAGRAIVVLAVQAGSQAVSTKARFSAGASFFFETDADLVDAPLPFCPVGWFQAPENTALVTDVAITTLITYVVIDV